jgi:imidazolonepropionase-like amidohydrolase
MILRFFCGLVLLGVVSWGFAQQPSAAMHAVLLRNVRLIDGTGAAPREHVSLLLRDGRIAKIGGVEMVAPRGTEVRNDLAGKTVMPGLISAHSHLGLIVDDAESSATGYTRENVSAQLMQFERYGVTTIMSLGVNRDLVYELRGEQRTGKLGGATIFTAGRGIGVPGGAPGLPAALDQIYRPATADEARKDVDELAMHRADLVKIWVDKGHGTMPEMTLEIYKAVIEEAHRKGLRVAAHVYALEDAKQLVADGVDVLAHSVRDAVVDDSFVAVMKQRGVWYVPTFTVDESCFCF